MKKLKRFCTKSFNAIFSKKEFDPKKTDHMKKLRQVFFVAGMKLS